MAYHRVLPRVDEDSFSYDVELVSAWEDEFDWQVGYLARHHQVITCRDLAELIDAGRPVPREALIITFDDGYRDNHDVVLPILRRHGVPAVVYVTTGYVGSETTYWYDQLVYQMIHSATSHLSLTEGAEPLALGEGVADRRKVAVRALSHLKTLPDPQRHATLARWGRSLGVQPPASTGMHGSMSWAQIRAMSDAGVEIGSHSVTHPVLAKIADDAALERELVDSKHAIEQHTGRSVVSLAYPVGGPGAYSERVIGAVRRAGYRFAFTYEGGINIPSQWDDFRLRRMAVERYVSRARFQAMLAVPGLFA
ncbi:MAG: polysaccharide deacetylase family protein [Pseudomonadota bacterium]